MSEPKNRLPRDLLLLLIHWLKFDAWNFLVDQGHPPKRVFRKYESLVDRGYLEYGTSVCFPWLTVKGEALVADLLHVKQEAEND